MTQLDEVLERLAADPAFEEAIREDPAAALARYRLTAEDLALLGSRLDLDPGTEIDLRSRRSRSAMFGLIAQAVDLNNEP